MRNFEESIRWVKSLPPAALPFLPLGVTSWIPLFHTQNLVIFSSPFIYSGRIRDLPENHKINGIEAP